MGRGLFFFSLIFFSACHPKSIPVRINTSTGVSIYKVYDIESKEVLGTGIDFSKISNLRLVESDYTNNIIGITDSREDLEIISREIDQQNKSADHVFFIWSSKPLRYKYPHVKAYALFAN